MARKIKNKYGASYCRSLVQSQKSAHQLPMKKHIRRVQSFMGRMTAYKTGHLSFGVVGSSHDASNDVLHVGVLYSTGSLATFVEPVDIETE